MEWVKKTHKLPVTGEVLFYYEAIKGDKVCRIWLGSKDDKRSTCWLDHLYIQDGDYYSDLTKECIVELRYWEAKRLGEKWLNESRI